MASINHGSNGTSSSNGMHANTALSASTSTTLAGATPELGHLEQKVLGYLDEHKRDLDPRWAAVARTHIEQGFMAANRALNRAFGTDNTFGQTVSADKAEGGTIRAGKSSGLIKANAAKAAPKTAAPKVAASKKAAAPKKRATPAAAPAAEAEGAAPPAATSGKRNRKSVQ